MRKYFLLIIAFCTALFSSAQLPVRNEPRHHNVFENEFLRILDVHLAPKDTTLYHLHNTPSVFIILSNSNVGSQLAGKQPQKGANINGEISYDGLKTPRFHRVWNEDTSWFHVMDIELTGKKQLNTQPVLQNYFLKLLFNEPQVNGYKVELRGDNELQLPSSANGYLLVSLGETVVDYKINSSIQRRFMKAGHYIWIEAYRNISIKPAAGSPADFVLLQMK